MLNETHAILKEFPEYKDRIHELKMNNTHFAETMKKYDAVDKEIFSIENETETPSDVYTENLKKKRLMLKDELIGMIHKKSA